MGEMKRNENREIERRLRDRFMSTLTISASILLSAKLGRIPATDSDKVRAAVHDSVSQARQILDAVLRRYHNPE